MEFTKEEILKSIAARKTYVAFTPHIKYVDLVTAEETELYVPHRLRANIFTSIDFPASEIHKKISNDEAILYIIKATDELEKNEPQTFDCEIGYFVDSHLRTDKKCTPEDLQEDDILSGVNCLTITYGGIDTTNVHRQTFVVNLDELVARLTEMGFNLNFGPKPLTSEEIKRTVLEGGFDASPQISIMHGYQMHNKNLTHSL